MNRFRVRPCERVRLKDIDPAFKGHHGSHKEAAKEIEEDREKLRALQELHRIEQAPLVHSRDATGRNRLRFLYSVAPSPCSVATMRPVSSCALSTWPASTWETSSE